MILVLVIIIAIILVVIIVIHSSNNNEHQHHNSINGGAPRARIYLLLFFDRLTCDDLLAYQTAWNEHMSEGVSLRFACLAYLCLLSFPPSLLGPPPPSSLPTFRV